MAGLFSGRWSELSDLVDVFEEGAEWFQHVPGIAAVRRGYVVVLHLALAREDRAVASAAATALERTLQPDLLVGERALFAAYLEDDPSTLEFDPTDMVWPLAYPFALMLMFLSERGAKTPSALLDVAAERARAEHLDALQQCVQIALALADGDDVRLAEAIEDAEAHGLVPHAARMRIVLAQRTGDHAYLERARPVLEQLGDRQFLRRLEEVQAALQ